METSPGPWISALRSSHDSLSALIQPLDLDQLQQPSYASEWSIAEVMSHLGSQAEIFGLFLDAGLSGEDPPGGDAFGPIWEAWNTRGPEAQGADGLQADRTVLERFESLEAEQLQRLHLNLFGMDLDTTGLARMRLGEHAIHTWDIAVALEPAATIAAGAVELLVDALDAPAARSGRPEGTARRVSVSTTSPERHFTLEIGVTVSLATGEAGESQAELRLPAEALVRLVYGRLDAANTPPVEARGVDLDELRRVFPGF